MPLLRNVCICVAAYVWTVTSLPVTERLYRISALPQTGRAITGSDSAKGGQTPVNKGPRAHDGRRESDDVLFLGSYPCGEGRCVCLDARANCSGKGFRYIPRLPSEVTCLDMSNNALEDTEQNADFFVNITGITWLDLSGNTLSNFSSVTFQLLPNLTHLNLSYNYLGCDDLSVVFSIPTLEVLILKTFSCYLFECISIPTPLAKLRELNLDDNTLDGLNLTYLLPFPGLTHLYLGVDDSATFADSRILMPQALHAMTHLTDLDLSGRILECDDIASVLTTPSLKVLRIRNSRSCPFFPDVSAKGPVSPLEELNLGGSLFHGLDLTRLSGFTRLRRLRLDILGVSDAPVILSYMALRHLTNLTYLNLSYCALSCDDLHTVLTIPSLEELNVRHGTVCTGLDSLLPRLNGTRLATLDLSYNSLKHFEQLSDLSELQYLDLSYNEIRTTTSDYYFPRLHTLNMRSNALFFLLGTCTYSNVSSLFPSLLTLDVSDNFIISLGTVCLPRLQMLSLRANKLDFTFTLFSETLEHLVTLDISAQKHNDQPYAKIIIKNAFCLPHIKSLNLADNSEIVPFTDVLVVSSQVFSGCSRLEILTLLKNDLKGITETRFRQLLGCLIHLTYLSLSSTGLTYITGGMFQDLKSLESLDLSHNSLFLLPDSVFESLPHLVIIRLNSNKITVVQKSAFSFATRQRLQQVDLSSNPLTCSCEVLPFQQWLLSSPSVFADSSYDYTCGNLIDTPVQSFFMQEQACLLSPETSKFIIATVSLIFTATSLLAFLYRYRWHIRLVLFEAFRAPGHRHRHLREHHFEYDVFVAYENNDFLWVRDHLMPGLEQEMGLKLCLHQRDFIPGNAIVDNIMGSVQTSKKLLMLFSRVFAASQWCQFELQLCLSHAMETQDVLIVVMLEDIPSRDLTPAMMAVMKTTTYIEWADDDDATVSFWRRIGLSLHEIMPRV